MRKLLVLAALVLAVACLVLRINPFAAITRTYRLYAALRECDDLGADAVLARIATTQHALSAAVRDRLHRAATRIVSGADL